MAGGCTTVEVKTGYGLGVDAELRLLDLAARLGEGMAVRIVPTLLALHAIPADQRDRRAHYIGEIVDRLIPAAAKSGKVRIVDAYCDSIAFTPDEVERLFKAAAAHGLSARLHAEQLSNQKGAALAAQYRALSADHLEHLDEEGAAAMASAGTVAVLLPGAFYALSETKKPPVNLLRKHKVAMAVATDCNPGTSPLLSPTLAINMACTLFGLTPEEAIAGMTINAARALGIAHQAGSIAPGKVADLAVWDLESLSELGYWIGHPGPSRRIFNGDDR
jgi:imidazolonepropionase